MLDRLNNFVASLLEDRAGEDDAVGHGHSIRFSYEDLSVATNNFNPQHKLGSGSVGVVYRGCLHGCTEVAVKVLNCASGLESFGTEVALLSRFRHPNLVLLLGWGEHALKDTKFLVYELLPGGSVGRRLYRCKRGHEPFNWEHRLRAAFNASCGLSYMVNSQPKAFHRDIKVSNILLDASGVAKMSDFGLAGTTTDGTQSRLNVDDISGTPGYLCPEYVKSGEVTERSEVYAFGVVLLELLTNELPAKAGPQGEITYPLMQALKPWVHGSLDRLFANIDSRADWPRPLVDGVATLALRCVHSSGAERPPFAAIVVELRRLSQSAHEAPKRSIDCAPAAGFCTIPPSGAVVRPRCASAETSGHEIVTFYTVAMANLARELFPESRPPEPQPPEPSFFTMSPPPSPRPSQPTRTLAPASTPARWAEGISTAACLVTTPPRQLPPPLLPESPRPGLGCGPLSSPLQSRDRDIRNSSFGFEHTQGRLHSTSGYVPRVARSPGRSARRGASCSGPRVVHNRDPLSLPRADEPMEMEWVSIVDAAPKLPCSSDLGTRPNSRSFSESWLSPSP